MRKLKLEIDSLDVQSFKTDDGDDTPGTVHGASGVCQSTYYGCTYTDFESCATCNTCGDQNTCELWSCTCWTYEDSTCVHACN
ncbi:MAG: hypothetical protein ACJ8GN_29045 [Longimicrobiaceae bacterium]